MIKLRGGIVTSTLSGVVFTKIIRGKNVIRPLRYEYSYICDPSEDFKNIPVGYRFYIMFGDADIYLSSGVVLDNMIFVDQAFNYLNTNDVVKLDFDKGRVSTLFRAASKDNFLLMTEQCNHYCLMCSQPPKKVNDGWLAGDILKAIPLFPKDAIMVGLTGGEPTILGGKFLNVLEMLRSQLPETYIHILSNGRSFSSMDFAIKYAKYSNENFCVGIPLYSDDADIHNYIVQSKGAFSETIRGILNLKSLGKKVELRIVVTKQNYERLPQLSEFISKNLLFVDHVAFMGMEVTGFAKANLEELWIDPVDYQLQLSEAVLRLKILKVNVSVFNHQLCTVDPVIWECCRKSISDWKNEFLDICNECEMKEGCGGFFATSTMRRSRGLKSIKLVGETL